jgi:hypothetical protein
MKRKLIPFVIVVVVMLLSAQPFAITSQTDIYDKTARSFIEKIATKLPEFAHWSGCTVFIKRELHDPASLTINAFIYELNIGANPCGYVIVDANSQRIIEFSSGVSPFRQYLAAYKSQKFASRLVDDEILLYCPGTYAISVRLDGKREREFFEFTQDTSVDVSVSGISRMSLKESLSAQNAAPAALDTEIVTEAGADNDGNGNISVIAAPLSNMVHYKLINGVPDTDYYISCIPTAIGNVIGYWDAHGFPDLIVFPVQIWTCIHEVSDRMIAYCGNNTSNAAIPPATIGYCRNRYPSNFIVTNCWNPTYSTYTGQIYANRPTPLGFAAGGPYGSVGHMTAGVGYYYEDGEPDKYSIVHDAWAPSDDHYVAWGSYNDFLAKIIP